MSAGARTELIDFTRRVKTARPDGGFDTVTTVLAANIFAAVQVVRATETENANRLAHEVTYLLTIASDDLPADLTTDDKMRWTTAPRNAPVVLNIQEIRDAPSFELEMIIVATTGIQD